MFQETLTVQDPETVEKAFNFGAIAFNVLVITITVALLLGAYALRSMATEVATRVWLYSNRFRFLIGFLMIVGLSILMVLTPDVNTILQAIGFNPDKSPVAIGIGVTVLMIGATSEPTKAPHDSI